MNIELINQSLQKIRTQNPLIVNITNYVVMNNTANALLAIGASPVMAHAVEEIEELTSVASALVINIGTLSEKWVKAMHLAGKMALKKGVPCILDPVGAGASHYRTEVCKSLIQYCKPTIIRGNASEIMALTNQQGATKGVDSIHSSNESVDTAKQLASELGCVISVSGAIDYITDGTHVNSFEGGSALMPKVTGLGCTATALTAAFMAVHPNALEAATAAMIVMGISGEMAAKEAKGPGTFEPQFIDMLYQMDNKIIQQYFTSK